MRKALLLTMAFAFLLCGWAVAQEVTVSGTVTDEADNSPLPGVTVIVKGTTQGTITDIDGKYSLKADQSATLVFSYVGYESQEVEVGAQTSINITMTTDAKALEEVVVTAVGIEANKASLGYSVQNLGGDAVVEARETNLVNALSSKVAGVMVTGSSGSPGASANIRIRGNTSINGSNSPLFVVDGVPIDNSSTGNGTAGVDVSNRAIDLNPNDIAEMTVLKGPAATVLYGIRAANGAVIITTKRGKSGKPVITLSTSFSADRPNQFLELQDTYAQGIGGNYQGPDTRQGASFGPLISSLEYDGSEYPYDLNGRLVPAGTGNGLAARAYDQYETFFVTGLTLDNNISVSGGTDKTTYYMSAGRLTQTGIVPNADFTRSSFKTTISSKLSDKLTAGMSASFINSGGNRIQRGSNISGVMLGLVRNAPTFDMGNGKTGQDAADDPSSYQLPDGTQRSYRAGVYDSPFWTVNNNPFTDDVNRVIGYTSLTYDAASWLKFSYKLGVDNYSDKRRYSFDINSADTPAGEVNIRNINSTALNSDFLVMINKEFGSDFFINATAGHNYFSTNFEDRLTTGSEMGIPGVYTIGNTSAIQSSEAISRRQLHGVFADVKLGYKDMLFLNLSGRNDWSSTLPSDANSFFYPAVSLGFVLSEAVDFGSVLPYAKLRMSYGQVGNDALLYATQNYYVPALAGGDGFTDGVQFPALGISGFESDGSLGNPNLKAELTSTFEIGGEFKFLNGRIGIDATYYNALTTDQIINVDIAASTGFTGSIINAGNIRNEGIELVFTSTPVKSQSGFSWDFDVNFTAYETLVEELEVDRIFLAGFTSTSSNVIAGQPYGVLYGGRFQRNESGDMIIGADGWPIRDAEDGVVGDPNPDWFAGVRNTFSYKGFRLTALLDIRWGGDVWNGTRGVANYFGVTEESAAQREIKGYVFDGVTEGGQPNTTPVDFGGASGGDKWRRYGFGGIGEEAIEDASWIRLRELGVSYEFPKSMFTNSIFSGVRLSVTGRNLFLITEFTGIDPEVNLTGASNGVGLEYFGMPNTQSIGANLRVTF